MVAGLIPEAVTRPGARIGLLGGSFNPAHEGHLAISVAALRSLKLDQVWWLISPRNPLKKKTDLAAYEKRLAGARNIAEGRKIAVLDLEQKNGLFYTVDTLAFLFHNFPRVHFVWLIGADCMVEFPRWKNWQVIMSNIPVAVMARPGYSMAALNSIPARIYARNRIPAREAENLAVTNPPAWVYIEFRRRDISGTALRGKAKG